MWLWYNKKVKKSSKQPSKFTTGFTPIVDLGEVPTRVGTSKTSSPKFTTGFTPTPIFTKHYKCMMESHCKSRCGGFTLIELLVVIAIIGILSTVVIASLNVARAKARDSSRIRSMQETRSALQIYYSDKGEFPYMNITDGGAGTPNSNDWKTKAGVGLVDLGYIKEVHSDIRYYTINQTLSGTCYQSTQTCVKAYLFVKLENKNVVLDSDKDFGPFMTGYVYMPDGVSTLDYCNEDPSATSTTDLCYDLEI
jgi:prepilin-type N-terminal cleavage/methylation domain-containing protein